MHIEVNDTKLWFDVEGAALVPDGSRMRERLTVLLLHGGPSSYDHAYFKPDFARLASVAQVIYLDLRDHGRSSWGDPRAWSFETCADGVRAFCNALGIVRPVVLGHSMGGFVAMLYAARRPAHAGALVLQSTNGRFDVARIVEAFRRRGGDEIIARINPDTDEVENLEVLFFGAQNNLERATPRHPHLHAIKAIHISCPQHASSSLPLTSPFTSSNLRTPPLRRTSAKDISV